MQFLIDYWPFIIIFIAMAVIGIRFIIKFVKNPTPQQLESIKQWAIYACAMAEASLGSGTGQLKMRATYDMFLTKFPALSKLISFEAYQGITETALVEFKKMLAQNPSVKDLIIKEGEIQYGNSEE